MLLMEKARWVDMTYLLLAMTQKVVATYDRIILECPLIHRPMTICMSLMNLII